MSLFERRRAAARADGELQSTRVRYQVRTHALREHFARHPLAWLLGGGFGAGLLTGLLPLQAAANTWRLLNGAATLALRSPLGAMLLQAATRHIERRQERTDPTDTDTRAR
jgi:hypothetical protein